MADMTSRGADYMENERVSKLFSTPETVRSASWQIAGKERERLNEPQSNAPGSRNFPSNSSLGPMKKARKVSMRPILHRREELASCVVVLASGRVLVDFPFAQNPRVYSTLLFLPPSRDT